MCLGSFSNCPTAAISSKERGQDGKERKHKRINPSSGAAGSGSARAGTVLKNKMEMK